MAVKWIAQVASELGMDVLDAIALLAGKGQYPMNGLLDEDRVMLLKAYGRERKPDPTASKKAAPAKAAPAKAQEAPRPASEPIVEKTMQAPVAAAVKAAFEPTVTQSTTPIATLRGDQDDRSESRTVIIPPPKS